MQRFYKVFDTEMFPAKEAWAPGIAAEAMLAVAEKGKEPVILMIGMVGGIVERFWYSDRYPGRS